MTKKRLKVLIVDDHPLFREGLAARIALEPNIKICGEADNVTGALAHLDTAKPDLVILDLSLKESDGLQLLKEIKTRDEHMKILVLSAYSEALFGERALRLGADGYVNKQQAQRQVIRAIRSVAAGNRFMSEELSKRLLEQSLRTPKAKPSGVEGLSDRELQVFALIGEGKSTRAIAEHLVLSVHTIETYREKIRAKLDLRNSSGLVQRAVQWVIENR